MKKRIVFVYSKMIIGGTSTALLSILKNFNYEQFDVTLLLFFPGGDLFDKIPSQVNVKIILKNQYDMKKFNNKKRKSIMYIMKYLYGKLLVRLNYSNELILGQILSKTYVYLLPKIEGK